MAEKDEQKVSWLKAISSHIGDETPDIIYDDIVARDNNEAPDVDLFVSGAPCPPFSSAGKRKGLSDERGSLILVSVKYAVQRRPPIFVLENVRGLASKKHVEILKKIKEILKICGYKVHCELMNTQQHSIPQHRPRLYLVAILKAYVIEGRKFAFPEPVEKVPCLDRFLDDGAKIRGNSNLSACAAKNVKKALKEAKKNGFDIDDPTSSEIVVDAAAGKKFFHFMTSKCPCITKARGGQKGFYLLKRNRFLTVPEMGALQGWRREWIDVMLGVDGSEKKLGEAFGDGMSLNILQRLLPRALYTVGLISDLPTDKWKEVPCRGKLPAAVYK